ncbi:NAD kinase 2 [Wolffia australiana]
MSRVASGLGTNLPFGLFFRYGGKNFDFCWDVRRCHVSEGRQRGKNVASRMVSARASLSNFFSTQFGLDSQTFQSQDFSQQLRIGPIPGEIAEIEAYCRIFRASEQLHSTIMRSLCNPDTGECRISYNIPSEDLPSIEEKIVALLGCMVVLLNQGREEVLSGRSTLGNSFRNKDVNIADSGRLPPLALFREEMKRYCESLHLALANYITPFDARSTEIWKKLQQLKNLCYDSGFSRIESDPPHRVFANWSPVYFSSAKEGNKKLEKQDVAFWKGGQVTNEGLTWLMDNGFKTIVDLRVEYVKDDYYQLAVESATSYEKLQIVHIPVEIGTAPSIDQIEQFATLVSDSTKRPIYLHSQEGVGRTSAMVSRWRQYTARSSSQLSYGNGKSSLSSDDSDIVQSENGIIHQDHSIEGKIQEEKEKEDRGGQQSHFTMKVDPFRAQMPNVDVFSRKNMSEFLRNRKVSPQTFFDTRRKRIYDSTQSGKQMTVSKPEGKVAQSEVKDLNGKPKFQEIPLPEKNSSSNNAVTSASNNGSLVGGSQILSEPKAKESKQDSRKEVPSAVVSVKEGKSNEGLEITDGSMCASATGVVRVQSRKKAEMYLVRTDGFSCTREKVQETSLAFTHPSTQQQMLMWKSTPKTVLLLKKFGPELMEEAKQVASYLYFQEKMNVVVEPDVHDTFAQIPGFGFIQTFYNQDTSDLHERVDFVTCLGGDGVILHASNLFRGAVPPVVSFNLGSLGFLTSHDFKEFKEDLSAVIHGNNTLDGVYITLRMRLRCEIFRNGKAIPGKVFDILNEIVVDRGSNPYLSKIECYEHNRLITKVQGDGVIIATPTGSTAYSTSAGGSMVHPNVPCILFTPICPHSLSFRPVILPDSAQLELKIPSDARSNAWVSFDGKRRQQLSRGDSVRIYMSQHPLPTVNKSDQTGDWFHSLIRCLNWNERMDQKAL